MKAQAPAAPVPVAQSGPEAQTPVAQVPSAQRGQQRNSFTEPRPTQGDADAAAAQARPPKGRKRKDSDGRLAPGGDAPTKRNRPTAQVETANPGPMTQQANQPCSHTAIIRKAESKLAFLSWFAGVDVAALALNQLGVLPKVHWVWETNPACVASIRANWPQAQTRGDVADINAQDLTKELRELGVEMLLVSAGPPCPDYSRIPAQSKGRSGPQGHKFDLAVDKLQEIQTAAGHHSVSHRERSSQGPRCAGTLRQTPGSEVRHHRRQGLQHNKAATPLVVGCSPLKGHGGNLLREQEWLTSATSNDAVSNASSELRVVMAPRRGSGKNVATLLHNTSTYTTGQNAASRIFTKGDSRGH